MDIESTEKSAWFTDSVIGVYLIKVITTTKKSLGIANITIFDCYSEI